MLVNNRARLCISGPTPFAVTLPFVVNENGIGELESWLGCSRR